MREFKMHTESDSPALGFACVYGKYQDINQIILEKIEKKISYEVSIKEDMEKFLETLTETSKVKSIEFLVFDIDSCTLEQFKRVYQVINSHQIPCLIISDDPSILHQLTYDLESDFLSFLPKSILNSMFYETLTLLLEKNTAPSKLGRRIKDFSLMKKPKNLLWLALFLAGEPLYKVLYLKFSTGFSWDTINRVIFSIEGIIPNFEFWFLFPLAAYALYAVRSWSFFFFIGLQVYALYSYFSYEEFTWPFVAETPHLSNSLMLVFNFTLIGYFLIPEHRRPFWNKAQRLWRDSSRYATNIKAKINSNAETTITNLSKTGAYFTSKEKIAIGDNMQLTLKMGEKEMNLNAKVRRSQPTAHQEYMGYGVEFMKLDSADKEFIQDYISGLIHRLQ